MNSIQAVVDCPLPPPFSESDDICVRVVQLLGHPSSKVVKPALRTVGNIVCAEDEVSVCLHVLLTYHA